MAERFAVLDTETNWENDVMSIGIVITEDESFKEIDSKYIIIYEAAKIGGMYSYALKTNNQNPEIYRKTRALKEVEDYLTIQGISSIFAYNASFDYRCLPELCKFNWHDILRLAAYKQYNPAIPQDAPCCSTGRLKSGYKVEDILCMFGESDYTEKHNALTDAIDELRIMKYLQHPISMYPLL